MEVRTVTTSDRSLLHAVRSTLDRAQEAFLCVAFVQERGLHLLQRELEDLQRRKAPARLLVTTTFQTTSPSALAMARGLGLEVRVLNPGSGRTFHPKLYLGAGADEASAVIGSANLTGGLATNYEAAVALEGKRGDSAIARAWDWAEALWNDGRVDRTRKRVPCQGASAAGKGDHVLEACLTASQTPRTPIDAKRLAGHVLLASEDPSPGLVPWCERRPSGVDIIETALHLVAPSALDFAPRASVPLPATAI